ncbi:hypothetical protein SLA2020_269760 [Shorea laevis]
MENYLNENFGEVKPKHSSEEALQRWRNLCGVVKNPKRRFRFTANLSKRYEAAAMRRTNQEKLRTVLVSKAAFQSIQGHDLKKLKFYGGVAGIAEKLSTSTMMALELFKHLVGCLCHGNK